RTEAPQNIADNSKPADATTVEKKADKEPTGSEASTVQPNKLYQNREERNNKIRNQQVELINKLQEENNSLKQKYKKLINDTNIHNARGAGRKPQSQEKTNEIVNRIEI